MVIETSMLSMMELDNKLKEELELENQKKKLEVLTLALST